MNKDGEDGCPEGVAFGHRLGAGRAEPCPSSRRERYRDLQPFQGDEIGPLLVCGPSPEFYEDLLSQYNEAKKIQQLQETLNHGEGSSRYRPLPSPHGWQAARRSQDRGREPQLYRPRHSHQQTPPCPTADAGAASLKHPANYAKLAGSPWMQIPHHGSLYNITQELVDHPRAKFGYVSAEGNDGHPHPNAIAAFKKAEDNGLQHAERRASMAPPGRGAEAGQLRSARAPLIPISRTTRIHLLHSRRIAQEPNSPRPALI